jgi:4-hydroxy-tetrahydrodipicolinate synthase
MSKFYGVMPYLVSPLNRNGRVNELVLADLCDDLIKKGVHGLTPLGSTGEYAYLSREQKQRVVEVVVEAAARRVPVIAGVASVSTEGVIEQARAYKKVGVDGIVGVLDAYFPLNDAEVQGYFLTLADAADMPVIVYTNPNFQRTDLTIDTICTIAHHPNIVGLKDASTNTGRLLSIMNRCGDMLDVFAASSHLAVSVLMMGGKGWFAGPACVLPEKSVELYNACMCGDWDSAIKLQKQLWKFNEVFSHFRLASCIKVALEEQGYDVGDPILPQTPLSEDARRIIREAMTID